MRGTQTIKILRTIILVFNSVLLIYKTLKKWQICRERTDESGGNQFETAVEREQKLVDLLRSAQEEREQLLIKLEQVQAELHDSRSGNVDKTEAIGQLSERVKTLECTLDAKHAEHKQLDQELAQAKDQCSGKQIEIDRLSDLLENARTKVSFWLGSKNQI